MTVDKEYLRLLLKYIKALHHHLHVFKKAHGDSYEMSHVLRDAKHISEWAWALKWSEVNNGLS